MKVSIVIASNNELLNVEVFRSKWEKHDCSVIVVDEGDKKVREKNKQILSNLSHVFYGPVERENWFRHRFKSSYKRYLSIIPEKCHAETSFGFLVACEEEPDFVIELDDDVLPVLDCDIVRQHARNLFWSDGTTVYCKGKWYNAIENLKLNMNAAIFARGHPYAPETRDLDYFWENSGNKCVLNMGLWMGCLDLDALTALHHGGLDGRYNIGNVNLKRNKVILDEGTYSPICSMNCSFVPEIIPAFYQLYMNFLGIDRFDDVWSGIFLKKVADHLKRKICIGAPVVFHNKRPRNVFNDIKKELEGMIIHETLWKMVDSVFLDGKTFWDSYRSLVSRLEDCVTDMKDKLHGKFLLTQIEKMKIWLELIDKLR